MNILPFDFKIIFNLDHIVAQNLFYASNQILNPFEHVVCFLLMHSFV